VSTNNQVFELVVYRRMTLQAEIVFSSFQVKFYPRILGRLQNPVSFQVLEKVKWNRINPDPGAIFQDTGSAYEVIVGAGRKRISCYG
jgi:hypothetical protein